MKLPLSLVLLLSSSGAFTADFLNVTYHTCYDSDTCTVSIAGVPDYQRRLR